MNTTTLDNQYWNQRWLDHHTGWDIGSASPPLLKIIDDLRDKEIDILIPGCGNAYEASYLLSRGFHNVTVLDISAHLTGTLSQRYQGEDVRIICGDFFEHQGAYDLILEQTFFCALDRHRRSEYVRKCHQLLKDGGILTGLLFDREFDQAGPPFGGSIAEYEALFAPYFTISLLELCMDSIPPRHGTEVFFRFIKK